MALHIFTEEESKNIKKGYYEEKLSQKAISEKYGIGLKLVRRFIKENNMTRENIQIYSGSGVTAFKDETGKKYGRLTVIKPLNKKDSDNRNLFLCQCQCGKYVEVSGKKLRSGNTKSCGCLQKEKAIQTLKLKTTNGDAIGRDLTGLRFGKLVVLNETEPILKSTGKLMRQWTCQCDCGNKIDVQHSYLTNGDTQSCGCIISSGALEIERCLKTNNINFKKEFTFSDLKGKLPYRFDFGILNEDNSLQYLIEFDGEQHYDNNNKRFSEERVKVDCEKNKYCMEHGIPLIRIPYNYKNSITIELLQIQTTNKNFIVTQENHYNLKIGD